MSAIDEFQYRLEMVPGVPRPYGHIRFDSLTQRITVDGTEMSRDEWETFVLTTGYFKRQRRIPAGDWEDVPFG